MELSADQLDEFEKNGFCVVRNVLSKDQLQRMRDEIMGLMKNQEFRVAGIGKEAEFQVDQSQRGDFICWIDHENPPTAASYYLEKINSLVIQLNRSFYLGIRNYECHYAVYPAGTFYKRHSDRHRKSSPRIVSMVFYLNQDWTIHDGGQLRIYDGDKILAEVLPEEGTLVIFLSEIEHEVLPTQKSRLSLTGWMRNA